MLSPGEGARGVEGVHGGGGRTHTPSAYLDLHGHLAAALHASQMHLPDGGSRKGPLLKVLQLVPPAGAQVIVERFLAAEAKQGP